MLQPPKPEKKFTITPAGTHIARVISLVQLGKIETEWQGQKKQLEKIRLTFELVDETHVFEEGKDPMPFVISQEFTLSMGSKSNLRPIVEGIIGTLLSDGEAEAFDVEELLGRACLITVAHTSKGDKTYANIRTTASLMKGQVAKEAFNPITKLTYSEWNQEMFDKLPMFIQEKMKTSEQYKVMHAGDVNPDEIPF